MFNCPICSNETKQLVIPPDGKLSGRCCANLGPKRVNVNLGQTVQAWTHVDKQGVEHKHRLTTGKDWEISNRIVSKDDGTTVVNKTTGKEAQY